MKQKKLVNTGIIVCSWLSIKIGTIFVIFSLFGNTRFLYATVLDFFGLKQNIRGPINSGIFSNLNMIVGITGVILAAAGILCLCIPLTIKGNKNVVSMQRQDKVINSFPK